jgi:hypothetical protein
VHHNQQSNPQSRRLDPRDEDRRGWSRETTWNDQPYHGRQDTSRDHN